APGATGVHATEAPAMASTSQRSAARIESPLQTMNIFPFHLPIRAELRCRQYSRPFDRGQWCRDRIFTSATGVPHHWTGTSASLRGRGDFWPPERVRDELDNLIAIAELVVCVDAFRPLSETMERICERVVGLPACDWITIPLLHEDRRETTAWASPG